MAFRAGAKALAAYYDVTHDGLRLKLRASPGAGANAITGVWRGPDSDERLSVKVTAPPDKGRANAAIIKVLAKALGQPKSIFTVASGETSRLKTLDVRGDCAVLAAALDRLTGELDDHDN